MHCREFEIRLNEVLDHRRDPAAEPRLAAHARGCESCRQTMAGQRLLLTGLRRSIVPEPSSDFSRNVVEVAQIEGLRGRARSKHLWFAAATLLASAAAVLLMVSLVWYARHRGRQLESQPVFVAKSGGGANQLRPRDGLFQRGPRGRGLAVAQRAWLIEAPRLPDHLRGSIDNLAVTLPETVERLDEMEQLAPGIRPIRLSLTLLWDAFCRALPSTSSSDQPPSRHRTSSGWRETGQFA
jgi:hypothetical protein